MKNPALALLAAKLTAARGADRMFFEAFFDCPLSLPSTLYSQLLRWALYGQQDQTEVPPLTPAILKKIVLFLQCHPRQPLDPFAARFRLPTYLARSLRHEPTKTADFVLQGIVQPYFRAMQGQAPFPGLAGEITAREACTVLAPAARRSLLSTADANRILGGGIKLQTSIFFFDSGVPQLDARNILKFAAVFFAHRVDRGGLLQRYIPTVLSRRVGVRRKSLPDFMLAVDLLALAALGAWPAPRSSPRSDLPSLLDALARRAAGAHSEPRDLTGLAQHHLRRSLLDHARSKALRGEQVQATKGRLQNSFLSGLLFNLERLVYEGAASGHFSRFEPLYRRIDEVALQRLVVEHYRSADARFGRALAGLMDRAPEEFAGIGCRSLANILFHARWLASAGEHPRIDLPSVAKFRLGMPQPVVRGLAKYGTSRRRPRSVRRQVPPLPVLERLSAQLAILDI